MGLLRNQNNRIFQPPLSSLESWRGKIKGRNVIVLKIDEGSIWEGNRASSSSDRFNCADDDQSRVEMVVLKAREGGLNPRGGDGDGKRGVIAEQDRVPVRYRSGYVIWSHTNSLLEGRCAFALSTVGTSVHLTWQKVKKKKVGNTQQRQRR